MANQLTEKEREVLREAQKKRDHEFLLAEMDQKARIESQSKAYDLQSKRAAKTAEMQEGRLQFEARTDRRKSFAANTEARSRLISSRSEATGVGVDVFKNVKPIAVGLFILLVVVGPGLLGISTLLSSMNLWLWGGLIVLAIIAWRNRK